jgi:hypothetical protein
VEPQHEVETSLGWFRVDFLVRAEAVTLDDDPDGMILL